jgi:hypothetical protein
MLAAFRELGCGIQRSLAGDLVAGQGVPDSQLVQRDRAARLVSRRRRWCKAASASPIVRAASRVAAA